MIKDSGQRRQFHSGAVRDMAEGKGRCDLMPLKEMSVFIEDLSKPSVLIALGEYQESGKEEYIYCAMKVFIIENYNDNSYTAFLELAKHFEEGAKKYGDNNWQKGIPEWCYLDSAVRHYLKFKRGDKDEPHDRAFLWNLICLLWTLRKNFKNVLTEE